MTNDPIIMYAVFQVVVRYLSLLSPIHNEVSELQTCVWGVYDSTLFLFAKGNNPFHDVALGLVGSYKPRYFGEFPFNKFDGDGSHSVLLGKAMGHVMGLQ